jgi:hypothetical protein
MTMWVLNVFLWLCFLFSPGQYVEMVKAGAPCYGYVSSLGSDDSPQPVCFYDPANINPGR